MQIQNIPTENLVEYARNPRKNDAVVDRMMACIREFGFRIPIVAKSDGTVVDGHLRLKAARKLGLKEVPVVNADDLTEAQIKAFRLVANQSANWAEWDEELLKLEFKDLEDLDYDLELTGFDLEDIQRQLDELEGKTVEEDDFDGSELSQEETRLIAKPGELEGGTVEEGDFAESETLQEKIPIVTKLGDLWRLGDHRLLCGDATKLEDVEKLMNGEKADMVFTDPPYNVAIGDKNKALQAFGKCGRITTNIQNDSWMTDEECGEKLWFPAFKNMLLSAKDNCSIYVTMPQGGTHMIMMMMIHKAGWQVKHELIWVKNSPTFSMGRLDYDYQHEPICFGWNKSHKKIGKGKCNKSIWNFDRPQKSDLHPTMKPIKLIANALENSSESNDKILDIFGGSGSTLIACEQLNRKCFMMEIDQHYCDVIIKRWQKLTGRAAILESTGETFDETEEKVH